MLMGHAFVAIVHLSCYNFLTKARGSYEKDTVRLPWQDLSQARHTKLYNAIPPFATG